MSQRILGVEIDHDRLAAVEVHRGWRGASLRRDVHLPLPAGGPDEERWEEARRAFQEWTGPRKKPDLTAVALPGGEVISAVLSVPFRRLSKVRQIIKFEMEPMLPLPAEEAVVDFAVIGSRREGLDVLAVALPKTALSAHLERLARLGVTPDRLGIAPLSVLEAWKALERGGDAFPTCLLHVGPAQVSFLIAEKGRPRLMRTIRWSGPGEGPAETAGEEEGAGAAPAPREGVGLLAGELQRTIRAYNSASDPDRKVHQIVLAGAGVPLAGLAREIESASDIPCRPVAWERGGGLRAGDPAGSDWAAVCGALGAALGAAKRPEETVNFLQEEFQHREGWRSLRRSAAAAGVAALAAGGALAADLALKIRLEEARLRRVRSEVLASARTALPPSTRTAQPERQLARLVEAQSRRLSLLAGGARNGLRPLDALNEISRSLPPALSVRLRSLEVDDKGIFMLGETRSFKAVNQIKTHLSRRKGFGRIEVMQARLLQGKKSVQFQIQMRFPNGRTR